MKEGKKLFFIWGFVLLLSLSFVSAEIKDETGCVVGKNCVLEEFEVIPVLGSTISINLIFEDKVKLNVDGQLTDYLVVGDIVELSNEKSIKIKEIIVPVKETEISSVVLDLMVEIPEGEIVKDELIDKSIDCNSGCILNDKCYNYGHRKDGQYCSDYFDEFVNEKLDNADCENNFECASNLCVDSECIEAGFFKKIMNWFNRIF